MAHSFIQNLIDSIEFSLMHFVCVAGSAWFQMAVCCTGVGLGGVAHDFIQEAIFRYDEWDYGWYMTLCELMIFVVTARVELQLNGSAADIGLRGVPWRQYLYLTVVLAITQVLDFFFNTHNFAETRLKLAFTSIANLDVTWVRDPPILSNPCFCFSNLMETCFHIVSMPS